LRIFRYLGRIPFRNFRKLQRVSAPKAPMTAIFAERECCPQIVVTLGTPQICTVNAIAHLVQEVQKYGGLARPSCDGRDNSG
jgi:hypothetical protein